MIPNCIFFASRQNNADRASLNATMNTMKIKSPVKFYKSLKTRDDTENAPRIGLYLSRIGEGEFAKSCSETKVLNVRAHVVGQ